MKYCTKCGTQLCNDDIFCTKCGSKVSQFESQTKTVNSLNSKRSKMNTRKHLKTLYDLITVFLAFSLVGIIITFIAIIAGEGALPFIICVILALSLYFSMVFLSVITDFYDVIVTKHQISSTPNTNTANNIDTANAQEQ